MYMRSPGNSKAAKTEVVWALGKIRWANQSDTSGEQSKASEERVDWHQVDWQLLRRDTRHETNPAGVERADQERSPP